LALSMLAPGEIVERPAAVGGPPVGHHACGIVVQGPEEALDAFLFVEREAPVEAEVEPALGLRRRGGDAPAVSAEVKTVHAFLLAAQSARGHARGTRRWVAGGCPCKGPRG